MTNIIAKKATEMYPAGAQNSLQFRTGFIEGAKWMRNEILDMMIDYINETYISAIGETDYSTDDMIEHFKEYFKYDYYCR